MNTLEIKNLTKNYKNQRGIQNINISIKKGEVFGFVGPNGAGKSTTIRCIMELINKNSGEIFINNTQVKREKNSIKEEIGYLPSEVHLYEDLTVEKMLKYSASFYKKDCAKTIENLVKRLDLDIKKKIDELSLGNLKKVAIVLALMHQPKILILDEATSGLDPLMQEVFYELIKEQKEKGTTIFFSSHILTEIKRICDRVGIIKDGKLIKVETIENITSSDFSTITIYSKNIINIKKEIDSKIVEEKENTIKLIYDKNINDLIKILSKYEIEKILIEELSLEEIFMHYYK